MSSHIDRQSTKPCDEEPAESLVDRLAMQYLDRVSNGERPTQDEFLAQLPDDAMREEFKEILRYAITVESCLPRTVTVGEYLGPYLLEGEIGHGGMGKVFRARDNHLERTVAIKVLPPHRQGDELYRKRFEIESKTLARLNHPNIVDIHEAGSVEGLSYLVMSLVDGRPFGEVVEALGNSVGDRPTGRDLEVAIGRACPEGVDSLIEADDYFTSAGRVFLKMVRAVEAAHARGVLHRDLKPANVLLTGGGQPVVLDFGLAGSIDREQGTITQGLFGTPAYLAPEQVRNAKVGADVRTDIYQLGLLLYEFLTFQRAFPGETLSKVTLDVSEGEFEWPSKLRGGLPKDLEAICLKAMSMDPGKRYGSASELGADVQRYLNDEPVSARIPGWGERARRSARRNRLRVTASISIVAAVLVSLGLFRYFDPRDGIHDFLQPVRITLLSTGEEGEEEYEVMNGGAVTPGALLFCEVEIAEDPLRPEEEQAQNTVLWAVQIEGDAQGGPKTIAPIEFATEDDPRPRLSHRVSPGRLKLALIQVPSEQRAQLVSIWLLSARKEYYNQFADWFGTLKREWIANEEKPLEYGERIAELVSQFRPPSEVGLQPRDGSVFKGLTPAARTRALKILSEDVLDEETPWPSFEVLQRDKLYFKLVR